MAFCNLIARVTNARRLLRDPVWRAGAAPQLFICVNSVSQRIVEQMHEAGADNDRWRTTSPGLGPHGHN
jgi:hypothetical protein